MSKLPNDAAANEEEEAAATGNAPTEDTTDTAQGQPGESEAKRIADALKALFLADPKAAKDNIKELTKGALRDEKAQVKEDAPATPKKMDDFVSSLKDTLRCNAVDFALFGRMTTSDYFEDVEAAMQVAHAISTHAVVNEVDYWTAVDDLGKAGGGAGHVDEGMFNSACFYKYFCLDWDLLVTNLAGTEPEKEKDAKAHGKWREEIEPKAKRLAACTLGHFIRAAAMTTPTGKQNSFASNCEPCGILVEVKKNGEHSTSYANAFADPVERIGKWEDDGPDYVSLEGRSIARFGDHVFNLRKAYGIDSTVLWHALPLYRFPLQGWEREPDGRKAKDESGKDKPPVQFANKCFDALGGNGNGKAGLVEAVIEKLDLGFKWDDVVNAGKEEPSGATS